MQSIVPRSDIRIIIWILWLFIHIHATAFGQVVEQDSLSIPLSLTQDKSPRPSFNENTGIIEEKVSTTPNLFQRNYFSGDWWGVRNTFSESGLDFEFVYKADLISNLYGGFKRGTIYCDNIDLIFSIDLERIVNWKNAALTAQILGNNGESPSELSGASQGISNIETVPAWKLYQLLLEINFFNEQLSLAIGLYDLNSEFDVRQSSAIFINPSHGIGDEITKSGLNGPSIFPTTSFGLRIKYASEKGNYFQTAFLDGVPGNPQNPLGTHIIFNKDDGLLLTAEYGQITTENKINDSKVALGAWIYTSKYENIIDETAESITSLENNYGVYFTVEKRLFYNPENHTKSLVGFLRIGYANENINPVNFYLGIGFSFTGVFKNRSEDNFGIAMAWSHNSSAFRDAADNLHNNKIKSYELNIEATYIIKLTPWLEIQPDLQYIINPSYCDKSSNAFAGGSRIVINF